MKSEKEFTDMVQAHKGTIYSVCYLFSQQAEEVDDLFQEVLINLWQGFERFEGRSALSTWVWRVSLNTCITADRKKRQRSKVDSLEVQFNLYADNDAESRQIRQLHERIRTLQPFDRAIVLLWLEGMPYEEIAAIVGISVKNVSVRLYRIKESLKQMSNPQKDE
ncbi:MAG: sigma-70 family RNA polymerase sigma factor [Rikenellaceae bacterium]|nr:sigma-70 family RNA polymerase sigma factor [Rikenellaceae bacterium]